MRHPREMDVTEIEAFLTMLATERHVSASTHNQALSALLFLYREVLSVDLPWLDGVNRPAQKRRIPSVLTKDEVAGLLACMDGQIALIARLLYGTGMRLMEGMRLRIKDVDFDRHVIIVREAKGGKDRVVMLPRSLEPSLRQQLGRSGRLIGKRNGVVWRYHTRWRASIQKLDIHGLGSGCFHRPLCRLTRARALSEDTICTKTEFSVH